MDEVAGTTDALQAGDANGLEASTSLVDAFRSSVRDERAGEVVQEQLGGRMVAQARMEAGVDRCREVSSCWRLFGEADEFR